MKQYLTIPGNLRSAMGAAVIQPHATVLLCQRLCDFIVNSVCFLFCSNIHENFPFNAHVVKALTFLWI